MNEHPQSVENYTNTCLVMGLVNLMWVMIVVLAWQGFVTALLLSCALYYAITRLDKRLARSRS